MYADNRAIVVVRVSKVDKSTATHSPGQQDRFARKYAKDNGLTVVNTAEDLSTSATIEPSKRKGLGPWLTKRFHEWDVILVPRTDRINRNFNHAQKLMEWCKDNEKALYICDEGLHMDYRPGANKDRTEDHELRFMELSLSATKELRIITKRNRDTAEYTRTLDVVNGGTPPYGYKLVPHPAREDGKQYGIIPEQKVIINRAADLLLAGMSWHEIADTLNKEGLPPVGRKGIKSKGVWHGVALSRILRSQACRGIKMTSHGTRNRRPEPVLNDEGGPIKVGEPLFTDDKWFAIQKEIALRGVGVKQRTKDATPLLGVVICAGCGRNLYRSFTTSGRGKGRYEYYKCFSRPDQKACKGYSFRTENLYETLDFSAETDLSDIPDIKWEFEKGTDSTRQLEAVRELIRKTNDRYTADPLGYPGGYEEYVRLTDKLAEQERDHAGQDQRADKWTPRETDFMISDLYFATEDRMERRRILIENGIKLICGPTPEQVAQFGAPIINAPRTKLFVPPELRARSKNPDLAIAPLRAVGDIVDELAAEREALAARRMAEIPDELAGLGDRLG